MLSRISRLRNSLQKVYPEQEARAISRLVFEEEFCIRLVDVYAGKDIKFSETDDARLLRIEEQLVAGVPVQYVLGRTEFCSHPFKVGPAVLIPRPETEELVDWAKTYVPEGGTVLDIGTGSGCIAVSLAAECAGADVRAWDISPDALDVACQNASLNAVGVHFALKDALDERSYPESEFDVIVSNPPYIGEKEKTCMEPNVLNHEPGLALFVPDGDELRFYRAIAKGAIKALKPGGHLFFEINSAYGSETVDMLRAMGYTDVELRQDYCGRDRMVRACL